MSQPIPSDIEKWLADSPRLTADDASALAKAAKTLDTDPEFQADYAKSRFVEDALQAMAEQGVSQSELARKWGRTRQYLSKLFNEDKRVNFTIETMVELSLLVGRKLEIHMLNPNESTHVLRCYQQTSKISPVHTDISCHPAFAAWKPGFSQSFEANPIPEDATLLSA